jgi:hypothetical protein
MARVAEVIRGWLGWCPNSHAHTVKVLQKDRITATGTILKRDTPQPGNSETAEVTYPDWLTTVAIVILFATLFFGGIFWWPLFVGAVLVAAMAYWYFHDIRGDSR